MGSGYPLHRENRENGGDKNPCQGKHRELVEILSKHRENTGNFV